MNLLFKEHLLFVEKLLNSKVEFLIIGGYAVIYHGYNRTTGDLDIWLKPTNTNKSKLIDLLQAEGYGTEEIESLAALDFEKTLSFSLGEAPFTIDFINRINLVEYGEAQAQQNIVEMDHLKVPFLHLNHLILSKMNTGRAKDAADIEELQKVKNSIKQ